MPAVILECLLKCPIDVRRVVAANVVLTGGMCEVPGFGHRLKAELMQLAVSDPRYGALSNHVLRPSLRRRLSPCTVPPARLTRFLFCGTRARLQILDVGEDGGGHGVPRARLPVDGDVVWSVPVRHDGIHERGVVRSSGV